MLDMVGNYVKIRNDMRAYITKWNRSRELTSFIQRESFTIKAKDDDGAFLDVDAVLEALSNDKTSKLNLIDRSQEFTMEITISQGDLKIEL